MTLETHHRNQGIEIVGKPAQSSGRSWFTAMLNGLRCRCPRCATGRLYSSYLKVADVCPSCDLELHHQRADDAPPYFTMIIVGHLLIPLVLVVERMWQPHWWVHLALWAPLSIVLTLWLLPVVKGAIIGVQWANQMHGFGEKPVSADQDNGDPTHLPAGQKRGGL
jgi:uncharacterized protein (DUF983 family)